MKKLNYLFLFAFLLALSCGQSTNSTGDETGPSPTTEADQQRYNLNPADQMHHESMRDSIMQDSLTDTL